MRMKAWLGDRAQNWVYMTDLQRRKRSWHLHVIDRFLFCTICETFKVVGIAVTSVMTSLVSVTLPSAPRKLIASLTLRRPRRRSTLSLAVLLTDAIDSRQPRTSPATTSPACCSNLLRRSELLFRRHAYCTNLEPRDETFTRPRAKRAAAELLDSLRA